MHSQPEGGEHDGSIEEAAKAMEMDVGELRREVKKAGLAEEK